MDHGQRNSIKKKMYKNRVSTQAKIALRNPKLNPVQFDDPYDHIHHIEHTHKYNHLIDTQ